LNNAAGLTNFTVVYSATLNDKAFNNSTYSENNKAYLEYSNNPVVTSSGDPDDPDDPKNPPENTTGKTQERSVTVYTSVLTLDKVDDDSLSLEGAEFTLSSSGKDLTKVRVEKTETYDPDNTNGTYYKLLTGAYTTKTPVPDTEKYYESTTQKYTRTVNTTEVLTAEASGDSVTKTVDASGRITFTGLSAGEYTLSETKTPAGYNTMEDITFTVTYVSNGNVWGVNKYTNSGYVHFDAPAANSNVIKVTVKNTKGSKLPETGGMGTTIFYIVGTVLVLAAAVLLVTRRRMRAAR
jgi:LPXTG-motif cell wall-anchored protein